MRKTCQICGENSGIYPLCIKHLQLKAEGKVIKCPECGLWHMADEICSCQQNDEEEQIQENMENEENEESETSKCLLCDNETESEYLFCKQCYHKYKDKKINVLIENLSKFTITDEYGNKDVKTCNGVYVRSAQEKIVYDELYSRNFKIEYEKTIVYKSEDGEIKELKPDFYLTDYNLYIEHWGYESSNDKGYIETKNYKLKEYEKIGKRVAGTSAADIKDISKAIDIICVENNIPSNEK